MAVTTTALWVTLESIGLDWIDQILFKLFPLLSRRTLPCWCRFPLWLLGCCWCWCGGRGVDPPAPPTSPCGCGCCSPYFRFSPFRCSPLSGRSLCCLGRCWWCSPSILLGYRSCSILGACSSGRGRLLMRRSRIDPATPACGCLMIFGLVE